MFGHILEVREILKCVLYREGEREGVEEECESRDHHPAGGHRHLQHWHSLRQPDRDGAIHIENRKYLDQCEVKQIKRAKTSLKWLVNPLTISDVVYSVGHFPSADVSELLQEREEEQEGEEAVKKIVWWRPS